MQRMLWTCWINTFLIPSILKKKKAELIFHLGCNNGLRKYKIRSVTIPYDIKAVAHRVLANVKIPLYKYLLYKVLYYSDFKHADYIVAMSEVDKEEIAKYYHRFANKIIKIYIPIDVKRQEKDYNCKENYLVALNLQFHHKNIITLIRAYEKIKDKIDYKLYLMGNVPKRVSYLVDYVKAHNLEDKIIFTGFLPEQELQYRFVNSALYINPTLYEGFGMTAVEAMIYRVPTLVSKIPTNYEITQGMCEYYEPPEDVDSLAKKILECINKKYDRDKLEEISKKILNLYNYSNISEEYYNKFCEIMNQELS